MNRKHAYVLLTMILLMVGFAGCSPSPAPREQATTTTPAPAGTPVSGAVANAIPYTMEFVLASGQNNLPALHAYCWAPAKQGGIYVLGGRLNKGLHMFTGGPDNFASPNQSLWWIDLNGLNAKELVKFTTFQNKDLSDPLMATNQQCYFDQPTGAWYIAGGYGLSSTDGKMKTFDTLIRIPVAMVDALAQGTSGSLESSMEILHNPLFKVTGGALKKTANYFVLAFGQSFDGNYNPFGSGFEQDYTEQVRYFQVKPGKLAVFNTGKLEANANDSREAGKFHRRDLPVVSTVDPADGSERIAAFGGVFPEGQIAGFTDAIYVKETFGQLQKVIDDKLVKRFSQYQCPTIPVYDRANKVVYHTFFGGIGHYWFFQSPSQHQVYEDATKQGRNDGLPFVEDITTLIHRADGTYDEYIATAPIPGNALRGSSVDFIPNPANTKVLPNGTIDLNAFANNERVMIGYIFGGIDADNPLPQVTNTGTQATNAVYQVFLTRKPSDGIPASKGNEAVSTIDPSTRR